jgi:hypothetical protein
LRLRHRPECASVADLLGWEQVRKEVSAMTKPLDSYRKLLPGARVALRALWQDVSKASRYLAWPGAPTRPAVHAGGVSAEWLRTHAVESAKHVDDS